ncbi:MAG TPA: helix-turn-helix transcriptional regulator [Actinocrinis sp.]|nr:helix-turn-helix transcriptional regulator [Actinocrinis sp.]
MTKTLADLRRSREATPEVTEAYTAALLRYELGKVVRERREELQWTQTELARRAGMRQPAVARFEAGGTVPTIPLLERLADALGLKLTVQLTSPPRQTPVRKSEERRVRRTKQRKEEMVSA